MEHKMTNQYFEKIVNVETGEETIRPFTEDEIAKMEQGITEAQAKAAADNVKELEKTALLAKLGITEDEAKLLLS
jgi:hypothetical protein